MIPPQATVAATVPAAPQSVLEAPDELLSLWPRKARAPLAAMLAMGRRRHGPVAVFDADGTLWQHDLEAALLAFLEREGRLSVEALPADLKLLPTVAGEEVLSYCVRLCEWDLYVGYTAFARALAGLTLRDLQQAMGALFTAKRPIPARLWRTDAFFDVEIHPPRVFPAQRQLLLALLEARFRVCIVSAASESLIRLAVSDPRLELPVPLQGVWGLRLLLRNPLTRHHVVSAVLPWSATADQARAALEAELDLELTSHLQGPLPHELGKVTVLRQASRPWRQPLLVAGNSQSDFPMLLEADVARAGVRLAVVGESDLEPPFALQEALCLEVDQRGGLWRRHLLRGWLEVTPSQLGGVT